ncbi:type II toxin-antitoxin system RelE/ParE family toxin [Tetragenococcus halophilus]
MDKKVEFEFLELDNKNEVVEFINSLPTKDKAKLLQVISKIETLGLTTAKKMQWIKKLNSEIYEVRSKVGSNIQRCLYFQKVGNQYIITHGFTKKEQKTPRKEIQHAKNLKDKYMRGVNHD